MGIVVHKNNIWKNCETLQKQDNNNIPYIYTFYHSEEREIHRYNFFIKTSLYQGNILGGFLRQKEAYFEKQNNVIPLSSMEIIGRTNDRGKYVCDLQYTILTVIEYRKPNST
jgi:hypothetical protein